MIVYFEVVYGLLLIAVGVNGLYFKKGKPVLSASAAKAHKGLESSVFVFPVAYSSLVVAGALVALQVAVPFALVLAAPTVLSIYLFNVFLQKNYLAPGLFFCLMNLGFAYFHSRSFAVLFG